ncbi:MAG: hypothetical protein KKA61_00880 [Nanoarchaeota archaeon]|nr:hypothetical protein [Nanoarchaeota archaeon]MBU4284379.1 hypothetical protein [Nanoarchaeota archaeon]MBU4492904.1 hypothetical protein [Nanoarchaeota archaeon]
MEQFQEAIEKANQKLKIADHMIFMTYPLVRDNRLLLSIIQNIFLALANAMSSILYYERLFKKIPSFNDNFDSKFTIFRTKCVDRLNIDKKYIKLISEIKDIIVEHRKSPVEFERNNKFVICSSTYRMRTISIDEIKKYITETRMFIQEANNIVSRNERIFR